MTRITINHSLQNVIMPFTVQADRYNGDIARSDLCGCQKALKWEEGSNFVVCFDGMNRTLLSMPGVILE